MEIEEMISNMQPGSVADYINPAMHWCSGTYNLIKHEMAGRL